MPNCLKQYAPYLSRSNLPAVLLAIMGNVLTVSTAVFTDSIHANELVSIDLKFGHGSDNVLRIARAFTAVGKRVRRQRDQYRDLKSSSGISQPGKVMWPNPTLGPSESAEGIQELEFFAKADRFEGTPITRTYIGEGSK